MASTYLTRTSTAGNRRTFTLSAWVKRSGLGNNRIFAAYGNASNTRDTVGFNSSNNINIFQYTGSFPYSLTTTAVFRDTSAWYHIVVAYDTTQATASDRIKLYVNGEQITDFSTETYPSQNFDTFFNGNTYVTYLGKDGADDNNYLDGSLAHAHLTDGTAYSPSDFGETDATTGIWKPKTAPSVTYGTNGFFLKFASSGSMGTDSSGNGNNFTVNGTLTQTQDTPANVFATLNALHTVDDWSLAKGNLQFTNNSTGHRMTNSNLAVSQGKWYCEVKMTTEAQETRVGVIDPDKFMYNNYIHNAGRGYAYKGSDGSTRFNDATTDADYGDTYTTGDIIGIAMDLDNHKLYFSKNGTFQNSGDPTSGATGTGSAFDLATGVFYSFGASTQDQGTDPVIEFNFGNGYFGTTAVSSAQSPSDGIGLFEYAVPSGYKALCTKSINSQEYS